jgi:transposase
MPHLESISTGTLRSELRRADAAKAAQRSMVAIAYEDGVSRTELARRYGYARQTIYNWLTRLERSSLPGGLEDDPRPWRPPRLDETDRRRLADHLRTEPSAFGYEASEWTTNWSDDTWRRRSTSATRFDRPDGC